MCAASNNSDGQQNLLAFLTQHYNGRIQLEVKPPDIRPPYLVAYHQYRNHYAQLRGSISLLHAVSKQFPQLRFAIGECGEEQLNINQNPRIYMVNEEHVRSEYKKPQLDVQGLSEFCAEFLKSIDFKSEPLPTDCSGLVKVAVALNFDELVLNSPKDIFITFHKSWNYFQQNILPVLERAASLLYSDGEHEHIEFVRVNVDANSLPHNWMRPYLAPLHFYVRANSKANLIDYNGETPLTVDRLIKFIAKHSTKTLKRYDRSGQLLTQRKAKSHTAHTLTRRQKCAAQWKSQQYTMEPTSSNDEWDEDFYDEWVEKY